MKKIVALLLTISMAITLLAGCGAGGNTIKIGMVAPLSGEIAVYGTSVRDAAQLAIDEINANGGINGKDLELIVYDNKGDATESITLFNRLVDNDKIDALVGPVISSTSMAVAPLVEDAGIPMITPTGTNIDITPISDFVFRACYTDPYQAAVVAKFATDELGTTKGAILYNAGDEYSEGLASAYRDAFTGEMVADLGYTAEDVDFKPLLTSIKDSGAETLFIPAYYEKVGLIATQAKEVGLEATLLGADGWDGVLADYADVVEGGYMANHFTAQDESDVVQNFVKAYTDKYGDVPNALAALGYDAMYIMANAIETAGSTEGADVVAAISASNYEGVTGNITFDENGDTIKGIPMFVLEGGEMVYVTKVSQ